LTDALRSTVQGARQGVAELEWREPESLEEALDLLATHGEDARVLAGGIWLTLVLRQHLLAPRLLVSLHRLPDLDRIAVDAAGNLHLGAMVRQRRAELSPVVRGRWPVLADTYADVANVRVRHQATVGGNLCDADYASDPPSVLAALGASVRVVSRRGAREIAVRDLIVGHYQTVLEPDELLVDVVAPPLADGAGAAYLKFRTRSHEDRPCVGVAAVVALDGQHRFRRVEVVVGAVADRPQALPEVLDALVGQPANAATIDEIAATYAAAIDPVADLRGSAWYRRRMIRVFVARALRAAVGECDSTLILKDQGRSTS
jgi:aerobic carbon-monoxide dehydrogenase medium subunit